MWDQFKIWVEHLFTPHCDECISRAHCHNCDQLYQLIERERIERSKLISLLTPQQIAESNIEVDYSQISRPLTWKAKKQQLERDAYLEAHKPKDMSNASI